MKNEQLLDAIGGVDETVLLQSEQAGVGRRFSLGRVALIAATVAALALSATAASGLFSRPITDIDVISGETVAPFSMDANGNILPGGVQGLKITMDVDIDEDAPTYLEEYYLIDLPEPWQSYGMGTPDGRYWLRSWDHIWWQEGRSGQVELTQSLVVNYLAHNQVDSLLRLSEKDGVTARKCHIAGLEVLKVTIPKLDWYDEGDGHLYCAEGETRLYWSDGRYILRLIYPVWVSDAQAEEILSTLRKEPVVLNVPENYGAVNTQALKELVPGLVLEEGTNTSANIQTAMGRVAYRDGVFYVGTTGKILSYDTKTGNTRTYHLSNAYADPKYMFVTGDYLGFVSDYDMLQLLPLSKAGQEIVAYEGIDSTYLSTDGKYLYALGDGLRRIDLTTGNITRLSEEAVCYDVVDGQIYAVPGDGQKYFLHGSTEGDSMEKVDLSFYPIRVIADGEDLYFAAHGPQFGVIRYKDGVETKIPIRSYFFQILDGHIIYLDEESRNTVKAYDLETGEIQVLQDNVFEFTVADDRYVYFHLYNQDPVLLDWKTGERAVLNLTD